MKYSIAALALTIAPLTSAAALTGRGALTELPDCASSATEAGISATGCAESDFACICGNSQFVTSLHNLIENVCSVADQQVTLAFAEQVCGAVGVHLSIPTPASSVVPATTAASVPSAIDTASVTSSASSYSSIPTPSAPYAFANGSTSINGTNTTIPFTGDAVERRVTGLQLAGSALTIALVMGIFL